MTKAEEIYKIKKKIKECDEMVNELCKEIIKTLEEWRNEYKKYKN